MRKTYPLAVDGKHPDRVLDAVKHDIRKYLKRERRRPLADGVDFLDFDCRVGVDAEHAEMAEVSDVIGRLDAVAKNGAIQAYVEILSKPGHKAPRPPSTVATTDADGETVREDSDAVEQPHAADPAETEDPAGATGA